ncbi:MAG: hypothetical protein ACP5JW_05230 [Candidatus Bathyarchaeia archaeon]
MRSNCLQPPNHQQFSAEAKSEKEATNKQFQNEISTITRVIIHPKYRAIGLGIRLVREKLPLAGTLRGDFGCYGKI